VSLRRPPFVLSLAATLVFAACALPAHALAAESDTPARGLIVRLKAAPAHEALNPRDPAARQRERAAALAAGESVRWRRVLGEAGLSGASGKREPRLRPVGRDQQLLDFERPLERGEALQLRDKLLQRPDVDWVELNVRERRLQAAPPSDPLFASGEQWWLRPVSGSSANAIGDRLRGVAGFQTAWLGASFAPVVVAVLDTGITPHPELTGRVLPGYDFVDDWDPVAQRGYANDGDGRDADAGDPGDWVSAADRQVDPARYDTCAVEDSSWHGTIVAGMIAANTGNGQGGAGIHWGAKILPVRVAGKCGADVPDIVDGMRWAAGLPVSGVPMNPNPARIVSISFGGSAACGQAYQSAVDELRARGVVVVAAAGNDWSEPSRPASCSGVVGVVGLNRDGFKSNYSNFGATLSATGIATVSGDDADGAWGRWLADSGLVTPTNRGTTTPLDGGYARLYGTSFAVPQVSGTLALMLSLNPQLDHAQLIAGLRLGARPHVGSTKIAQCSTANPGRCICTTATCGVGILDAEQALLYAQRPDSYTPPNWPPVNVDSAELDQALAVAPQDRPGEVSPPTSGVGGDGGGAFGAFWLMALFTASVALWGVRPLPRRR